MLHNRRSSSLLVAVLIYASATVLVAPARPALAQDVAVHENLFYKTGSGLSEYERERCALDLYLPEGEAGFPVIVWFHGGNITAGDCTGQMGGTFSFRR